MTFFILILKREIVCYTFCTSFSFIIYKYNSLSVSFGEIILKLRGAFSMDKNTLSNYGWLLIAITIIAVFLALATPLANAIKGSIIQLDNNLFQKDDETVVIQGGVSAITKHGINVELTETGDKDFRLIPGVEYNKSITVSVLQGTNVDIYIFVKADAINNADKYLEYTVDPGVWTPVPGVANVYYCEVVAKTRATYNVLLNDRIAVKTSLTANDMPSEHNLPNLNFTSYAVQQSGFANAAEAWSVVGGAN